MILPFGRYAPTLSSDATATGETAWPLAYCDLALVTTRLML